MLFFPTGAKAADVRVLLESSATDMTVTIMQGQYRLINEADGLSFTDLKAGDVVNVLLQENSLIVSVNGDRVGSTPGPVTLKPQGENAVFGLRALQYREAFTIVREGAALLGINTLDMEYYLYGVVGREIGYYSHPEANKAQAVACRSYAYASIRPGQIYDVTATTLSQVYSGYSEELKAAIAPILEAVRATAGEVVFYTNPQTGVKSAVRTYYHSNAGGHTENPVNVWGGTTNPPLKGVPSPWDNMTIWQRAYTPQYIAERANSYGNTDIGRLMDIKLYRVDDNGLPTDSGRVFKIEIIGDKATVTAYRDNIRVLLRDPQGNNLSSTLFDITKNVGLTILTIKDGEPFMEPVDNLNGLVAMGVNRMPQIINGGASTFWVNGADGLYELNNAGLIGDSILITGTGTGHGIGMSQLGARGMAAEGYTYKDILAYYYFSAGGPENYTIEKIQ